MTVDARFCPQCGSALPGPPPTRCTACSYELFVNARPTATVIITRGRDIREACERMRHDCREACERMRHDCREACERMRQEFLAIRRAIEPRKGLWELPGGFCDGWEHPAEAAVREAREELGVTVRLDDFVGMYLGSYEFQGETLPVLDCFWLASIVDGEIGLEPSEASEYRWLSLADAPRLAFETMDRAVAEASRRLRAAAGRQA